jgi:2-methylcitrate dehydratase PrpD
MKRRDLLKSVLPVGAALMLSKTKIARGGSLNATSAPPQSETKPPANGPDLTKYVVEFVQNLKFEDIPPEIAAQSKTFILDGFGLALAGSMAQSGPISRAYVQSLGPMNATSTVIGTSLRTTPRFAAFVNGVSIHADDFDDTQLAIAKDRVYGLLTHPTAPVLPGAFALAETGKLSGKEMMVAYLAGVEVETKIAEAIAPRHYVDGFHSSGTCGSFGSVSAAAKLKRLTLEQTLNAFGIAGAEAAGLRENFGTMTKPFQAGHAAENGVAAADLAGLGWTAADKILDAPRGFFHAYGGSFEPTAIMNKLGNPWTYATPGVSIKPYPSGSLTHPAMTAMLRLIQKNDIKPADVEKVDVGTNKNMPNALIHHKPTTGLQAKFSMEFCIAVLLLERKASLGHFSDEFVNRAEVKAMVSRVNFYVDPVAEQAGYDKMTSLITVHLKNGKTLTDRADFAKGSPADPMTLDEVSAKFRGCAEFAKWPKNKTDAIINLIGDLERAPNVNDLAKLLTGDHD